jgi:hypothetical protein
MLMLLDEKTVSVDFNGIVIFAYPDLATFLGGSISNGKNILANFTQTDLGDAVLDAGKVIPIVNIDDGGYLIRFYDQEVEITDRRSVIFSDSGYIMSVENELFVADAAVFWDWEEWLGWEKINIKPGYYAVTIEGVRHFDDDEGISRTGYDIIMKRTTNLLKRTAKIRENSRV